MFLRSSILRNRAAEEKPVKDERPVQRRRVMACLKLKEKLLVSIVAKRSR